MADVDLTIPAQSGGWVEVPAGARLRIIDVAGTQVADMFAVRADDKSEWLSAANTRGANWSLFPAVGGKFVSTRYQPMFTFVSDDSPGHHDALFSACDPMMYRILGDPDPHPNCAENFRMAADEIGWQPQQVPDPINFFQLTPVGADGGLSTLPAPTQAGDSVTLVADMDLCVVVTACAMDVKDINGFRCTPIRLEVS